MKKLLCLWKVIEIYEHKLIDKLKKLNTEKDKFMLLIYGNDKYY